MIVRVLPAHRQRREMPIWSTRYARAVGVNFLMTTDATQRRHTSALSTAYDVCEVAMAIVALLRIVCGGVTVDAAWRNHDGINLLPGG